MATGRNPHEAAEAGAAVPNGGDVGGHLGEDEAGSTLRARARELGERIDALGARGFERVAEVLEQTSDAIADRAGEEGGAKVVVEPLRRAGRYVADSTPSSALADLDRAIERHPYRSMAVGVGVGWAIGRLTRRIRAG